jgi:hypothetical protein
MPIDRAAAETFIWSTARLVDRHRYAMLFAGGSAEPVSTALAGYQNPDGGFGHALEPDLRCPSSQPGPTLYALEMLEETQMLVDSEMGRAARAWVAHIADSDGGIPSALPGFEAYPHAPWWTAAPGSMLTFAFAAVLHAGGVVNDAWLAQGTEWCWRAIEATPRPSAYWLKYACAFLDAVPDEDRARGALTSLATTVDPTAIAPAGGADGEALRPLDLSPHPGSRSRDLVTQEHIEAHLDAVEAEQQEDGGWMFDWPAWALAQTADWRGNVTIRALVWLRDNGRLP